MKILYLNAYLNRFDFWTGERGRQFAMALRSAGAEVETLPKISSKTNRSTGWSSGPVAGLRRFAKTKLPAKPLMMLIEVYLFARGIGRTLYLPWQAWCKRRHLRPDVVLARTFEYDWGPWLVAAVLRRPLILEVHSPFFIERGFRGRGHSRFLRWLEIKLWHQAECLWVLTPALKEIIAGNGIEPDRIRVIPFGLSNDCHRRTVPRCNGALVRVVFVGSFYPWHGVNEIIEAFSIAHGKFDNLRLCLIGEGVTRARNEQRVRMLGMERYVEFPGWLPLDKVASHLENSDIGVAPYRRLRPFYFEPVKILDYMSKGLAIIASDQGHIQELLSHGESGILVPPDNVPALAQALIELAQNEPLRHRLGLVARERVPDLVDTAQRVLAASSEVTARIMGASLGGTTNTSGYDRVGRGEQRAPSNSEGHRTRSA